MRSSTNGTSNDTEFIDISPSSFFFSNQCLYFKSFQDKHEAVEASVLSWQNKHIVAIQDQLDYPQCRKNVWNAIKVNHHNVWTTVVLVWYIDIVRDFDEGQRDHNNDCTDLPLRHGLVMMDHNQVLLHLDQWNHIHEHSYHQHIRIIRPNLSLWF